MPLPQPLPGKGEPHGVGASLGGGSSAGCVTEREAPRLSTAVGAGSGSAEVVAPGAFLKRLAPQKRRFLTRSWLFCRRLCPLSRLET